MGEKVTHLKYIISGNTYSRLCVCGIDFGQGPHSRICTANLPANATMGDEGLYVELAIMSYLFDTIIDCYIGYHAKCVLHSFVCTRDEAWSRPYVSTMLDLESVNQIITPTPDDRDNLRKIIFLP